MELLTRRIRLDEVEQEITQRDQFDTDTVGLSETLIREALQNSTDGRSSFGGPVTTRIRIVQARDVDAEYWRALFSPLVPHLDACKVSLEAVDISKPRLLVLEDFGTTGLLGKTDAKDDGGFSDFWRRIGRSHKRGEQGGRWGLGKLVFSSASRIRTLFGITVQEGDVECTQYLMGQSVLKNHRLGGSNVEYAPHAAYAVRGPGDLQLPEIRTDVVAAFAAAAQISRTSEPGLSIVVPFVREEISEEKMLPHVIRN